MGRVTSKKLDYQSKEPHSKKSFQDEYATFVINIAVISHPFRAFNWGFLLIHRALSVTELVEVYPMISDHTLSGLLATIIDVSLGSACIACKWIERSRKTLYPKILSIRRGGLDYLL